MGDLITGISEVSALAILVVLPKFISTWYFSGLRFAYLLFLHAEIIVLKRKSIYVTL